MAFFLIERKLVCNRAENRTSFWFKKIVAARRAIYYFFNSKKIAPFIRKV